MKDKQTIEVVVRRKLCTGCGTCAGICPQDALDMIVDTKSSCYIPLLDRHRCTRCGLCYEVCPGHSVDFEGLNVALFGDIPEDVALGRYLGCYVGHATDEAVRYNSASGGLVSSLLVFALEEGLIESALVTRTRQDRPLRPEPFLARTKEEILSAAGSRYCPVAANVALKTVMNSEDRVAVVGLPCHIQGIRKAERHILTLAGRIRYRISIACSLDFSFQGTVRFLKTLGVSPEEVDVFQYRGRGWPGSAMVRLKDGSERTVPYPECYGQLGPHSMRRCTLCSDMLGELSDLTCGDAWVPEIMRADRVGSSFVVSRTPEGEELLERAASKEAVELSELDPQKLLASQGHALFKKRKLKARMRLFKLAGQSVPTYQQKLLEPIRGDYAHMVKFYMARYALSGDHRILGALFRAVRWLKRSRTNHARATTSR